MKELLICVLGYFLGAGFALWLDRNTPKVELPEEYQLIDTTTNIQGQYNPNSKTLKIWFNHNYKNS